MILSNNQLCGLEEYGGGTYTSEGIMAISDALYVSASLTKLDVRFNGVSGDGISQLSAAVLSNTKIESFNEIPIKEMLAHSFSRLSLSQKGIGVEGGMVIEGLLPFMASLTSVRTSPELQPVRLADALPPCRAD